MDSYTLIPLCQPTGVWSTVVTALNFRKEIGFYIVNFGNDLPEYLVTSDSVNIFKNRFDKHCSHLHFSTDVQD